MKWKVKITNAHGNLKTPKGRILKQGEVFDPASHGFTDKAIERLRQLNRAYPVEAPQKVTKPETSKTVTRKRGRPPKSKDS